MLFAIISLFAAVFLSASLIRQANTKLKNEPIDKKNKSIPRSEYVQPKKPIITPLENQFLEEAFLKSVELPALGAKKDKQTHSASESSLSKQQENSVLPMEQADAHQDQVEKYRATPSIEALSLNMDQLRQQRLAQRASQIQEQAQPSLQAVLEPQSDELKNTKPLVKAIESLGHYDFASDESFDEHIQLIQVAPRKPASLKKKKKKKDRDKAKAHQDQNIALETHKENEKDLSITDLSLSTASTEENSDVDNENQQALTSALGNLSEDEITPQSIIMQELADEVSSMINLGELNQRAEPQIIERKSKEALWDQKALLPYNLSDNGLLGNAQNQGTINYDLSSLNDSMELSSSSGISLANIPSQWIDIYQEETLKPLNQSPPKFDQQKENQFIEADELNQWWISVNVSHPKLYQQIQAPSNESNTNQIPASIPSFNTLHPIDHIDQSEDGESKMLSWQEYQAKKVKG